MFKLVLSQTANLRQRSLEGLQVVLPFLIRLLFGIGFFKAGFFKLKALEATTTKFAGMGIPMAELMAPVVAIVELVGGLMILVGFGTRLASFFLAFTMLVALLTAYSQAFSEGIRAVMETSAFTYLLAMLVLLAYGAGKLSLDAWLAKRRTAGK